MTKKSDAPLRPHARRKASAASRALARPSAADVAWAADVVERMLDDLAPMQRDVVDDPSDRITLLVPRHGGKSTVAAAKSIKTMVETPKALCFFVALTKESAARIIWKDFKLMVDRLGLEADISETQKTVTLKKNGSTFALGGADDLHEIEKYRGFNIHAFVIDEGASHASRLLERLIEDVVGPRLLGWLMICGTPGSQLVGLFCDATRPGGPLHRPYRERNDQKWRDQPEREWSSHHWTLAEAGVHVPAIARAWQRAIERKRKAGWLDTNPKWQREYLGIWASDGTDTMFHYVPVKDGAPWNQWDPPRDKFGLAKLPGDFADWMCVYVFDKGSVDNFAVNLFAFSPSDSKRRIWHRYCFESPGMYARSFACLLLGVRDDDPRIPRGIDQPMGLIGATGYPDAIVGDTDLAFLDELKHSYFIRAVQADKRQDAKVTTVEEVNGDFAEQRIYILKGSKLEEQLTSLRWKPDEFGVLREDKSQANHSTDCLIYGKRAVGTLTTFGVSDEEAEKERVRRERVEARTARKQARTRDEDDEEEDGPRSRRGDWGDALSSRYEEPWLP